MRSPPSTPDVPAARLRALAPVLAPSIGLALALLGMAATVPAEERFPPPDFQSGYELPPVEVPQRPSPWWEYVDTAVLVAALGTASWLSLGARSRRGIFFLTIFAVAYFGFWRKGCVCPIGAIQNVALALANPSYAVPTTVAAFFILPLAFTLFFGRSFCGGVCPLGAIQDLVLVRPVRLPRWVEHGLRLGAYVYLGLAVLFAATASAFVICQYDPFVGFFRLSGSQDMILLGAAFLVVGMFVGRPYCRFLCPYGVLLGIASRFSRRGVKIAPDSCVRCKLCEEECPFGAIDVPEPAGARRPTAGTALGLLALAPVLVVGGLLLGGWVSPSLARVSPVVRLSERVALEDAGRTEDAAARGAVARGAAEGGAVGMTAGQKGSADQGDAERSAAWRATGRPAAELHARAADVRAAYGVGAAALGAFLGLAVGIKLIQAVMRRRSGDYEVHRSSCLSCGRCFFYCPQEHARLRESGITVLPTDVSRQL